MVNIGKEMSLTGFRSVANPRDFLMLFTDIFMRNNASQVRFFQYILLTLEHIEMG